MSQLPLNDHSRIITIERHILEEQKLHPEATGVLTNILYDIALAGKYIASHTTRAGLADILGSTQEVNVQGEKVMRLDRLADDTLIRLNDHTGRLAAMASEEHEYIIPIPAKYPTGKYVLLFDPLDGSSNVDTNTSIGTIFAIYRRKSTDGPGTLEDCLQPGSDLVVAGYLLYSTSTMFVYTSGAGVHGFTLDTHIGEFLLSHPNMHYPEMPKYYSCNQGYQNYWSAGVRRFTRYLQGSEEGQEHLGLRYIGSLVGDFHRNLITGGVYYYPADSQYASMPNGKLRLVYEAAPLAFIAEQAGGYASDGRKPILNIHPSTLHQRTPLFIGDIDLVHKAEELIHHYG